jgi:hypothetical protein
MQYKNHVHFTELNHAYIPHDPISGIWRYDIILFSLSASGPVAYALFGDLNDGGFVAIDTLSWTTAAVPVPAPILLMLSALGGIGLMRRRR